MGVTIIIGAQASSRIMPRTGVRPLLLTGTVLAACGFAWLSAISPDSSYWTHVFGPGCLIALALGLLFTPLAAAATSGVAFTDAGLASGVLNTSRQIGRDDQRSSDTRLAFVVSRRLGRSVGAWDPA